MQNEIANDSSHIMARKMADAVVRKIEEDRSSNRLTRLIDSAKAKGAEFEYTLGDDGKASVKIRSPRTSTVRHVSSGAQGSVALPDDEAAVPTVDPAGDVWTKVKNMDPKVRAQVHKRAREMAKDSVGSWEKVQPADIKKNIPAAYETIMGDYGSIQDEAPSDVPGERQFNPNAADAGLNKVWGDTFWKAIFRPDLYPGKVEVAKQAPKKEVNTNAAMVNSDPLEGKVAKNPKTGEKIIRKGGKWVPYE
jgi:hypothetical protein